MHRRDVLAAGLGLGGGLAVSGAGLGIASANDFAFSRDRVRDTSNAQRTEIDWGSVPIVYSIATTDTPTVYLTFDDGPNPEFTARVLDTLAERDYRATFFLIGRLVEEHPELARRIVEEGHTVANHSYDHPDFTFLDADDASEQLARTKRIIRDVTGVTTTWFRPPRGALTGALVLAAGETQHQIAMWSVARGPSDVSTPEAVADHIERNWTDGRILDLHDGLGRTTWTGGKEQESLRQRRNVELEALKIIDIQARVVGLPQ